MILDRVVWCSESCVHHLNQHTSHHWIQNKAYLIWFQSTSWQYINMLTLGDTLGCLKQYPSISKAKNEVPFFDKVGNGKNPYLFCLWPMCLIYFHLILYKLEKMSRYLCDIRETTHVPPEQVSPLEGFHFVPVLVTNPNIGCTVH